MVAIEVGTRPSARIGMRHRIDVFGVHWMPLTTIREAFDIRMGQHVSHVRLWPTVFGVVPVLITGLEGIVSTHPSEVRNTDPTKRTIRRKTGGTSRVGWWSIIIHNIIIGITDIIVMHLLTRRSTRIIGRILQGIPPAPVRHTLPSSSFIFRRLVVRFGPAILVVVVTEVEFPTRFEGIWMRMPVMTNTDPIKNILRGKAGSSLRCHHQTLGGGRDATVLNIETSAGGRIIQRSTLHPDRAIRHEQQHPRYNNSHHFSLRMVIHGRWWKVGGNEGNRSFLIFVPSRRILVRHPFSIPRYRCRCVFGVESSAFLHENCTRITYFPSENSINIRCT